jgi:hypothetical protein
LIKNNVWGIPREKIEQDFEKETMDLIKVPTEEYLSFSRALRW